MISFVGLAGVLVATGVVVLPVTSEGIVRVTVGSVLEGSETVDLMSDGEDSLVVSAPSTEGAGEG